MTRITVPCRHGRSFAFAPDRTAVLAIDMQKEFFADRPGAHLGAMRAMLPRAARLLARARGLGCRIIHTRESYRADMRDVSAYRRALGYVGREGPLGRFCLQGQPGHDFMDEVAPLAGEAVVDKPGFSAFYGSNLDGLLREARIERLILAGVTTQCCVHSTLREAVDRGYWCLTVADCCAATEPGMHDAALAMIASEGHLFGWICDVADLAGAA